MHGWQEIYNLCKAFSLSLYFLINLVYNTVKPIKVVMLYPIFHFTLGIIRIYELSGFYVYIVYSYHAIFHMSSEGEVRTNLYGSSEEIVQILCNSYTYMYISIIFLCDFHKSPKEIIRIAPVQPPYNFRYLKYLLKKSCTHCSITTCFTLNDRTMILQHVYRLTILN